MFIENEKVVSLHYVLTNDGGEVLDQSSQAAPLQYIQGKKNIIPGLEKEMLGKKSGDKFHLRINPEEAYGLINQEMIQTIPIEHFKHIKDLKVGMSFQFQTTTGQAIILRAIEITNEQVVLDGNHPLAGIPLNFMIEIIDIRNASAEELAHGHLHKGAGCCGGGKSGGHCHDKAFDQDDNDENDDGMGSGKCSGGGCC